MLFEPPAIFISSYLDFEYGGERKATLRG